MSGMDEVTLVAMAGVVWGTIYGLLQYMMPRQSSEWNCRVLTVMHAAASILLSAWCVFIQGPWPFTSPGTPNTALQVITMGNSIGYFLFDICWCVVLGSEGLVMLCHHLVSILGLSWCLYIGESGIEMVATLFGAELTNPMLQYRWFLRETGRTKSRIYEINNLAFVLSFAILRSGFGTWLLCTHLTNDKPRMSVKCGATSFYMISQIFVIKIGVYALRKYRVKFRLHLCERNQRKLSRNCDCPTVSAKEE
ncbi:PREDICTED: transmembrane protein 136-like [Priapulus caudatus]|uniref:Transmembrane protein 136-like n=1 Tax=Priapulus caudatus TaxID=37621 RepID=A0ABM1EFT9_PRICU|nr:PREDICTED: transmembrane protein 136-like [Priapulus caudatus]